MIGKLIELLAFYSQVDELLTVQAIIIVTGDHSTPVIFGDHSFEPVPFVIAPLALGQRKRIESIKPRKNILDLMSEDTVCRFDENSASQGVLGRFTGAQVMPLVLNFLALSKGKCAL